MTSGHGEIRDLSRRAFLAGSLSALASGCLTGRTAGPDEDWKSAFRALGFDPDAAGCGVFAVVGDPHATKTPPETFKAAIRAWNGMSPRPLFALSLGDQLCDVSRQFGDREWPADPKWRAACDAEIEGFKSLIAPCEVPFRHVIGNHDTYPDEVDAGLYASHFPGWRPYERFEACGVQFMLLNGGHDGSLDAKQLAWIGAEVPKLDPNRALVIAVHQPSMLRWRENAIPRMIRQVLSGWTGELWVLGGHEHCNALARYHLPNGTPVGVATHTRAVFGYWLYGVRRGSVVARLFVPADGFGEGGSGAIQGVFCGWKRPQAGLMPSEAPDRGMLPVPFENTPGVLWKTLVGEDGDKQRYRVEFAPQSDAGHWYFYIGRTTYRLPLGEAKGATKAAFLGKLFHHRKTGEHEKVYLSSDNRNWVLCPEAKPQEDVYAYEIPVAMRGAEWIYLRVDGFEFGCDSCIAGYALLA